MKHLAPIAGLAFLMCCPAIRAQQTDPTLTAAVIAQTAELSDLHKKRKKAQEKIILAEQTVTLALERVHDVENKMLSYLKEAQSAVTNIYQIGRVAQLVGKDIPANISRLRKAVKGNLEGTAVATVCNDRINKIYSEMSALVPFMAQLVSSGTYNSTEADGSASRKKVNLLNSAERYYIANEVQTRLENANTALYVLAYQVEHLHWRDLFYRIDPKTWCAYMDGKARAKAVATQWKSVKW